MRWCVGPLLLLTACGDPDPRPPPDITPVAPADPGSALPAEWQTSGAFMEIFVRGYKDSDGDGIGDLRGVTSKLDYLQELGIKGIWLMPITASYDHDHGYAVTDYRALERSYGTVEDLDELLAQAHARGIGVIVDYVMNHSAADNLLFADSRSSRTSLFRDWYVWTTAAQSGWNIYGANPWRRGPNGWYFAPFWDQMPDFNLENADVVAYHHDNLRFWLNRGVDGFRFDAVGNLVENGPDAWEIQPENYAIMGEVHELLAAYSQRYLVCEAPADPLGFAPAGVCGSAFAFGLNYALVNAVKGSATDLQEVADYFNSAPPGTAVMAANHDSFAGDRIYDQLAGDLARYRLLAGTYLTLPGIPFIYYGEEIGMSRGPDGGDPGLRTPMSWTRDARGFTSGPPFRRLSRNIGEFNVAAQEGDPESLLSFYKAMLALRNAHRALARGSYEQSRLHGRVLTFQRRADSDRILVVLNYGDAASVDVGDLPAATTLTPLYPAGGAAVQTDGNGEISLTPGRLTVTIYQF